MRNLFLITTVFFLFLLVSGCASVTREADRYDISIQDGRISRRDNPFTIRAVLVPDLCARGGELDQVVPAMARIAEVGGNAVAFDLCGFNDDGTELAPAALDTVAAYAERAKDQRMMVVVRVLGDSEDAAFRANAVETAGRKLSEQGRPLYWIDGPDASMLALRFKRQAPHVLVAAPENGDIRVVSDPVAAGDSGLMLLVDSLPLEPHGDVNYVLPEDPETYALLDEAYRREAERNPWTPDNSLLSAEEREAGFISLFNGRDLDNWWHFNHGEESFRVNEEGHIECYQSGAGGLVTRDRYKDFVLRLEYRFEDVDANSGIHLWMPRAARQSKIGFEFQLLGDSQLEQPTATSTGSVYDVLPPLTVANRPEGEWNEVEIMLQGSRLRATINGVLVQDVDFDEHEELRYRLRRGFIALQDHDDYVAFRNVRVKVLDSEDE